jgi:hypothetical protein
MRKGWSLCPGAWVIWDGLSLCLLPQSHQGEVVGLVCLWPGWQPLDQALMSTRWQIDFTKARIHCPWQRPCGVSFTCPHI